MEEDVSKADLVCCLLGSTPKLYPSEKNLLEIKLFAYICNELTKIFNSRYSEFQRLIKFSHYQEDDMCNTPVMQEIIKDILSTNEYSLTGIATHTRIPEEILTDLIIGINNNPTFELSKRIFELHISVRPKLYDEIMKKIALEYLKSN